MKNVILFAIPLLLFLTTTMHAAEAATADDTHPLRQETIMQAMKRKASVLAYGEAPVFCGEIQSHYYDQTLVKAGSLARRGERALEEACTKKIVDYVFIIIEFFKTRPERMNPVNLDQASRVLLEFNERTLAALSFAKADDTLFLAKITAAQQALQ